jgi:hypothetical protein
MRYESSAQISRAGSLRRLDNPFNFVGTPNLLFSPHGRRALKLRTADTARLVSLP